MTQTEKEVLQGIVRVLQNLTMKIDAVEGALIRSNLLPNGLVEQILPTYAKAAADDLALIRSAVDSFRTQG